MDESVTYKNIIADRFSIVYLKLKITVNMLV
ncbi:hypothetical protein PSAC2689_70345 [Paraburkholderia sacchari]